MRKVLLTALFLVLAFQVSAFAADLKIGILDSAKVLRASEPGKAANAKLTAKHEAMKKDIDRQSENLKKMTEDFKKQSMALSLDARQSKEIELKRKYRDLQDADRAYKQKMRTEFLDLMKPMLTVLDKVIADHSQKNNFTLVLDANKQASQIFLFIDKSINLNEAITAEFNAAWAASGNK